MDTLVTGFLGLLHFSLIFGDSCHFPGAWQGEWYQSGVGDITIGHNSITRKGVCRDRHRDYYLLENQEEHCHQCLLLLSRHHNILQYKESYCIGRDSLQSICAQIRIEAVLYTLVREPSYPVPCPIRNAFYVQYNNNSGGFCRSPMSYVHQCASSSLFQFEFKQCQYSAYTYDREIDFRCLATWKDGSDQFLYGLFDNTGSRHKDDVYRCVIYTVLGTVVYMSVSADPTCRGLRSPKDGPMVMELTQDVYGWPEAQCRYPRWLLDCEWRDLSGRYHYIVEPHGNIITTTYRAADNFTSHQSSYHCLTSQTINDTYQGFIALVHVLDHCEAQYRCIKVKEKYSDMIEINLGDYVPDKKVTCSNDNFRSATIRMLIPDGIKPQQCPYSGRFVAPSDASGCQKELKSSCDLKYSLDIVSSCQSKPLLQLECHGWWDISNRLLLLAKEVTTGLINCFSLSERGGYLTLSTDHSCNLGVSSVILHQTTYKFRAFPEPCATVPPSPSIRDPKHIDSSQDDDPGGGYSHMELDPPTTTKSDFQPETPNFKQFTSGSRLITSNSILTIFVISFSLWICYR